MMRIAQSLCCVLFLAGCSQSQAQPKAGISERKTLLSPESTSASWPCWRGPGARGVAVGAQLPANWAAELTLVWSQPLGDGWSSPVIDQGRVFVTDRKANQERLLAFDLADGKPLWSATNSVSFEPHAVGRRHGNGPKSTPAVAAGRVYSLGIAGWLQCVDAATGKLAWKHNLPAEFSRPYPLPGSEAEVNGTENVIVPTGAGQGGAVPLFGYTGSLLLVDGKVVLSVGGDLGGTIMAFDAATGNTAWSALRENVSYSSPVSATLAGVPQIVVMTGPRVCGLRLTDGELLWSQPFQIQYDESISTPAVADDTVLVTGDGKPLTALRVSSARGKQQCDVAWENTDLTSYLSSMLVRDGHVYGMADDGQLACVRLSDGKTLWQGGDHGYYCSPILAGDRLLALNEEGSLLVLAASPHKYTALARSQVANEATWTMPALAGSRLVIRSGSGLACFELKP